MVTVPMCDTFGGWSELTRQINQTSWQEGLDYAVKLGQFCGTVSLAHFEDSRDWVNDQPFAGDLYTYNVPAE